MARRRWIVWPAPRPPVRGRVTSTPARRSEMASKLEQDISAAIDAATRTGAGGPADDFLGRLAERVGAQANVKAVFGEPIERDGLVVVPVAKVRWGFGGGAGSGPVPAGMGAVESDAPNSGFGQGGG